MKIRLLAVFLFILFCLTGCAEPHVLEEIGLVTTAGYDVGKNGIIKGTAVELKIEPDAKTAIKIVEAQAYSIRGIKTVANKKTSKRLLSGQLRVIVLGEEMVNRGILHLSEAFTKDPSISDLTYLAIVEGEARDLLNLKDEHIPDIGLHIYRLIEQNTKGEMMPSSTLQETLHRFFSEGRDPLMPILKKIDNKEVSFSGVGIFKDDRLVGKISPAQSFYLKLINDKYKAGSTDLIFKSDSPKLRGIRQSEGKTVISLDTIKSKSDIKLLNRKNLEFDIKIKLDARLIELNSDFDITKPNNLKLLEEEVSKEMEKQVNKLITYCQSKYSDVLGLGEVYRISVRNSKLTKKKWHKMYKNAKVNVNIDFNIMRSGIND